MKKRFFILLPIFYLLASISLIPTAYADDKGLTQRQSMPVTAFVGPQPPDYQFNLAADDNPTTIYNGKYYDFTITYGAKASAKVNTANTILVFDWSQALAPNNENMFAYVYGSAGTAYGGAKPVIDTTNKTITWTIPNMPPGTIDQKVGLQLFANSYDKTTAAFPLTLTATMNNEYVTMPDQTLTEYYQYQAPPPGPTATPGPQPTATPTPPPPPPPLYTVDISGISPKDATISITTQYPSKLSISYGTSPTNLSHTIASTNFDYHTSLTLPDLLPDTHYYFQVTITSLWGYSKTSEIYTFHTAKQELAALPLTGTAVISSGDSVLLSEVLAKDMSPGISLLTAGSPYDITVSLPQNTTYQSLEVVVQQQLSNISVAMTQQQPGISIAHMTSLGTGTYDILLRTIDDSGVLTEMKLTQMRVISPLTVTDKDSGSPIVNSRIFLSYFDQGTNSYKPVSAGMFGLGANPGYTDSNGIYAVNLPPGKYRAEASALLYNTTTVDFTLGKNDGETFPRIILQKNPTNLVALMKVIKDYVQDTLTSSFTALKTLATSSRVFHVVATATTGFLILVSYLLFLLKSHTSLKYLPLLFFFHLHVMLKKHKGRYLFGTVTDAKGLPLSLVRVEIEDADTKTILGHTTTNKTGKFYFRNIFPSSINLIFIKEGFQPENRSLPTGGFPEMGLHIMLETGKPHHASAVVILGRSLRDIFGMLFETALVLSIILEILFFFFYGFEKTAPFLILSIINIVLWLFYLRQQSKPEVL